MSSLPESGTLRNRHPLPQSSAAAASASSSPAPPAPPVLPPSPSSFTSSGSSSSMTTSFPPDFFHDNFQITTPLWAFLAALYKSTRLHLVNQVKYTCNEFRYVPQGPVFVFIAEWASAAGSEEFYCVAIPIMLWSSRMSTSLSTALVLLLCVNLYVGNVCKNLFCLPRPPLVYRKVSEERNPSERTLKVDALGFGWPSTHSCNAISLPFAVLRTAYGSVLHSRLADLSPSAAAAYALALAYAILVPASRLVMGVHSAADVHAGMLYGVIHLRLWLSYHSEIEVR